MSFAAFAVRKKVVPNLYMVAVIAAGLVFGMGIRREFFPSVEPTEVVVVAPYPGAAPDEVERSIAVRIEDRVADLDDLKEVRTTVTEGLATLRLEFFDRADIDRAVADVKRIVDSLQDLPAEADRIVVDKVEPNIPVIILSLAGSGDERAMKEAVRSIRDDLRSIPGMGDVIESGTRGDEISVEASPAALLEHGVPLTTLADQIRRSMADLPGGAVKTPTANVTLRTLGAEDRAEEVRRIVVKSGDDGRMVRVGDLATVEESFVDADVRARLNGDPAVSLTIFKVGDEDAVEIADLVKAYVAGRTRADFTPSWRERLAGLARPPGSTEPRSTRESAYRLGLSRPAPPGELTLTTDLARFIVQRLELLSRNALTGAALVFLTLMFFLSWRAAWWVLVGLFVAVMGTLVVMRLAGITMNLLSMFGLIIVLGMLVDDGIVVAENIIRRTENGEAPLAAAVKGTDEVAWPVLATVVTTVFAFLPLLMIGGRIGDLLGSLPWVVAVALAVSLVEAYISLPSHMGHSLENAARRRAGGRGGWFEKVERRFDLARDAVINARVIPAYTVVVGAMVRRPWLTLAGMVSVLIVSVGMIAGGRVSFVFFSDSDTETITADLSMPIGTPVDQTDAILRRVESAALAQPEVSSVFAVAGGRGDLESGENTAQTHLGQLFIELHPVEARQARGERTSDDVILAIRRDAGELPGVRSLRLVGLGAGPEGAPITLTVLGDDADRVAEAARSVKDRLSAFDGVYAIADDADQGQRELRLTLRPGASELGLTPEQVGRQVRGAAFGLEAHTFAGDREDVDVRVRYPESVRRSLAAVEATHLFTPAGDPVPLAEVVRLEEARGYATARRLNRDRAVTVTADVDNAVTNPELVMSALTPMLREIERAHPGVRVEGRGRQEDMADSFATLPLGLVTALALNFVVLAWLFQSYTQPLVIMTTVPFSIIGMVWGHFVMGFDLTILSLIGFVALSGVVVNDAIVFMEFFNQRRREGVAVERAVVETGAARFRAIMLTTITTIAGLGPLMFEQSFQARILIPMSITICFGLAASTMLVLLGLPCMLVCAHRVGRLLRFVWLGRADVPPLAGAAVRGAAGPTVPR